MQYISLSDARIFNNEGYVHHPKHPPRAPPTAIAGLH